MQVPTNDAVTVVFWINATTVGQIPIEVWAYAGVAGDAERRMLLVTVSSVWYQLLDILENQVIVRHKQQHLF